MKRQFVFIFIILPTLSFSQGWQWVKNEGGAGIDNGHSICTDGNGNCYTAFDSSEYAMISKYNSAGNSIWKVNIWNGHARTIISDNAGRLYVSGDSSNQVLIAKYDSSGNEIWKTNGGAGNCNGISLDNAGYIYLTGSISFLQKFDTSGNQIWIRNVNATGNSICTDNLANCYITGKFSGTVSFGTNILTALGSQDIFIAKYDSSGNCIWAKRAGGNSILSYSKDCGYAVTADNSGNIYFTGSIVDTVDFDSIVLVATSNDIFLAKYDTSGTALWVKQATGLSDQEGRCIALNNQGNILIGGSYVQPVTFNSTTLSGWGNYDAFIAKYGQNGNFINAINAGGAMWNEYVYGIATDNSGNVFAAGSYCNTAYFGNDSLVSSGNYDTFTGKIDISTNIEESEMNSFDVKIYPNPSNGFLTVEVDKKINVKEIRITDLLGKIIFQLHSVIENRITIDNLQSGMYFLTVIDNENRITNRKIISSR